MTDCVNQKKERGKPRAFHSAYLSGPVGRLHILRNDAIAYRNAQQGCEDLRIAMFRYYAKRRVLK